MTQQIHDQMSAFWDDELSAEECAFLVRRLEHDPEARGTLVRYATIGCALRGELLQPDPGILRRRLEEALTGAPAPVRRAVVPARWPMRAMRPAFGLGIAASVAIVGVFALRNMNGVGPQTADALQQGESFAVDSPAYVVPRDFGGQSGVSAPIRLTNYLMHHGEYATHLSRTSVHSNVVGARDDPRSVPQPLPEEAAADDADAADAAD